MHLLTLSLRNLARRRTRSLLTAAGVAVAIGGLIGLIGTVRGLERGWIAKLARRDSDVLVVRKGTVEILSATLDERIAPEIARIAGVAEVSGELLDLIDLDNGEMIILAGWPASSRFWNTLRIKSGRLPTAASGQEVIIGQSTAAALAKKPGMPIMLGGSEFRISGIFAQRDVLADWGVIMPLAAMQVLLEKQGRVTVFNLRLEQSGQSFVSRVIENLRDKFPTLTFTETSEVGDNNSVLRVLRSTAWVVSLIALAIAVVVIINTLMMSVVERTPEIGVLRAVGWRSSTIFALVATEGMILTAIGTVLGIGLGLATLHWVLTMSPLRGMLEAGLSVRIIGEVFAAALLLGSAGSLIPAWHALKLDPIQALRSE
ncbi:MAG: FtsX-like permease family protein [Candidatus Aminicenantes bacterium]|nr:FtsX-like permease family protein [Candidatus Aminicenantes bacterium]